MKDISLKDLLEAGCHFGHRAERWHPKAAQFIYESREGLHIIDLAKTRESLKKAAEFLSSLGKEGKSVLFVATKRQAKSVVTEAAKKAGAFYLTSRWIGGFITNWEEVKKNIDKVNRWRKEKLDGSWKKFPKHEIVKLEKELRQHEVIYGGVTEMTAPPAAFVIVDIKREIISLKEAIRKGITTVAIVDTNTDPTDVDYPIPANDDAVGSIQFIVNFLSEAYTEGKKVKEKEDKVQQKKIENSSASVQSNSGQAFKPSPQPFYSPPMKLKEAGKKPEEKKAEPEKKPKKQKKTEKKS